MSSSEPRSAQGSAQPTSGERGPALLRWARERLREHLGGPVAAPPQAAWASAPAATFVSLHWPSGELQGCIGSLEATRSIVADVARNAIAAGTRDMRGRELRLSDVDDLEVEVSILSPIERVPGHGVDELKRQIRPGVDGLLLEAAGRRGTLLPVVWRQLPEVDDFYRALETKAGLPHGYDGSDLRLFRYTSELHHSPPTRRAP